MHEKKDFKNISVVLIQIWRWQTQMFSIQDKLQLPFAMYLDRLVLYEVCYWMPKECFEGQQEYHVKSHREREVYYGDIEWSHRWTK
jgi:hypothetical protein